MMGAIGSSVGWDESGNVTVREKDPIDRSPACYYCDPYAYPGVRYPGAMASVCWEHSQMGVSRFLPDVGLPSGKRASWKRGIWT